MCYYIKTNEISLIAKRNILASKETDNFRSAEEWFQSPYRFYKYTKNSVNPEVVLKVDDYSYDSTKWINEGYHSYRKASYGNGLFLIPKGSIYYASEATKDEYVSSQIIYLGENSFFKRLKVRLGIK